MVTIAAVATSPGSWQVSVGLCPEFCDVCHLKIMKAKERMRGRGGRPGGGLGAPPPPCPSSWMWGACWGLSFGDGVPCFPGSGVAPNPHLSNPNGLPVFTRLRGLRYGRRGTTYSQDPWPSFPEYDSGGRNSLARAALNARRLPLLLFYASAGN